MVVESYIMIQLYDGELIMINYTASASTKIFFIILLKYYKKSEILNFEIFKIQNPSYFKYY